MAAAAADEGKQLAGEATPPAGGLIVAFLPSSGGRRASGAGQLAGEESLSAAKTPLLQVNPLAL
jgi:hypothetical protein